MLFSANFLFFISKNSKKNKTTHTKRKTFLITTLSLSTTMNKYKRISDRRALPTQIRVVMTISGIIRIISIATWVVGLTFMMKYSYKYIDYTKDEKKTIYCNSCMFSYLISILASCVVWVIDPIFLSNAIGAYIRNHYGASIDSIDDENFEAACDFNEESSSIGAKCLGCGFFRRAGIVYHKGVCMSTIRSENSKNRVCGNYMCFTMSPFAWTKAAIKHLGYGGAVALSFAITLLFFAGAVVAMAFGITCYTNDVNCLAN